MRQLNPEFRRALAIADGVGKKLHDPLVPQRAKHGVVELSGALDVANTHRDVMQH